MAASARIPVDPGSLASNIGMWTGSSGHDTGESLVAHLGGRELLDQIPAILYFDEADPSVSCGYRNLYISAPFSTLLGYTSEELETDPELWTRAIHPDDQAATLTRESDHYATGEPLEQEFRLVGRDGQVIWVSDRATFLRDASGQVRYCVGVLSDISERKRLEIALAQQALSDPLTGLANRTLFRDRVEHALATADRTGRACAALFLDLDRFKTVNDSLGHAAGDRLLVAVAESLRQCLRASDTLARLGGDEFAVLVEQIETPQEAVRVAERLVGALARPFWLSGREIIVRTSIGIAVSGPTIAGASALLRAADLAMYEAKSAGRGSYALFEPTLHQAALDRLALEHDLRAVVASGGLAIAYQPVVDLANERIVGAEALVRWSDPVRGPISPREFVPLAEEIGLIIPIGRWVRAEAFRTAAGWVRDIPVDASFTIGVNVSARELVEPGFVEHVERALAEAGLSPDRLVIELVETSVHQTGDDGVAVLRSLRERGVGIALDDFGTGHSSLGQLDSLPISILKLDRTFIQKSTSWEGGDAAVEAVVRLGHAFGHIVVAEGVEEPAQAERLLALGADRAQGYLFGRPAAADVIGALIAAEARHVVSAGRTVRAHR